MLERRLTFFTLIAVFSLLILGGVVHNTQSSLACPDWPLCYGQVLPPMQGKILIEHSHRLLASLVGLLTLILAFLFRLRRSDDKVLVRLGYLAVALVILQGVLGGITVIYRLPTYVSTSHLSLAMIFFCLLIYIYHRLSLPSFENWTEKSLLELKNSWKPSFTEVSLLAVAILFFQIVLGAFVRHSGAGAACGLGVDKAVMCLDPSNWNLVWWPKLAEARVHMAHRILAIVVSFLIFWSCFRWIKYVAGFKSLPKSDQLRLIIAAICPPILVLTQVFLGLVTVAFNLHILPLTGHLAIGSLTLVATWSLFLRIVAIENQLFPKGKHSLVRDLLEIAKPKLALLVLMTSAIGVFMAPDSIGFFEAFFALLFIAFVVAGAAILNCYIEIEIDRLMERTKLRSLPSGRLRPGLALWFGSTCIALGFIGLLVFTNWATAFLALLAAIVYLFGYTPMKQRSLAALFLGAIAGAIPPVLGWTAAVGTIDAMALLLFGVLFFWQLPHFLAISIYLRNDYSKTPIKIFPNVFGLGMTKFWIIAFTLGLVYISFLPAKLGYLSEFYGKISLVLGGLFLLQSVLGLWMGKNQQRNQQWAQGLFWGSIAYLPLLLGSMIFFK